MENKATSRRTWNEAPGPARFHSDSDSESVSETGSPRVPLSAERRQPDIARSHRIDDDLSDHYIASPRDPSDAAAEASALQVSPYDVVTLHNLNRCREVRHGLVVAGDIPIAQIHTAPPTSRRGPPPSSGSRGLGLNQLRLERASLKRLRN